MYQNIIKIYAICLKHKIKFIITLLSLVLSLVLISKFVLSNKKEEIVNLDKKANIQTSLISSNPIDEYYIGFGIVESINKITLKSESEGKILKINISEGMNVQKGDIIAELDSRDYLARFKESESNLKNRKIEYDAVKALKNKGLSSNSAISEAKANFERAQAEYIDNKRSLENRFIKSPFDGFLAEFNPKVGSLISAHQDIGKIIRKDIFKVRTSVSDKYVKKIKVGQEAIIAINGNKFKGNVLSVNEVANPQTKTFDVDILIEQKSNIFDGQVARVNIQIGKISGYYIPVSSLSLNEEGKLVIKHVVNGKADEMEVEILNENDGFAGITSTQVPESIELITLGNNIITRGSLINIEKNN